jgi:hypothetical protein
MAWFGRAAYSSRFSRLAVTYTDSKLPEESFIAHGYS